MAKKHITLRLDERILEAIDKRRQKEMEARTAYIEKELRKRFRL